MISAPGQVSFTWPLHLRSRPGILELEREKWMLLHGSAARGRGLLIAATREEFLLLAGSSLKSAVPCQLERKKWILLLKNSDLGTETLDLSSPGKIPPHGRFCIEVVPVCRSWSA